MRNLKTRVKRLEEDEGDETCMIVTYYDGETKEQAMERYYEKFPHMRDYKGPYPFLMLDMFREKDHA